MAYYFWLFSWPIYYFWLSYKAIIYFLSCAQHRNSNHCLLLWTVIFSQHSELLCIIGNIIKNNCLNRKTRKFACCSCPNADYHSLRFSSRIRVVKNILWLVYYRSFCILRIIEHFGYCYYCTKYLSSQFNWHALHCKPEQIQKYSENLTSQNYPKNSCSCLLVS